MPHIYVDADACPVKEETYKVAARFGYGVTLVANAWMRTPDSDAIELVVVGQDPDEADDWIAERAGKGDVVVTQDIPLASRCLANGARALNPRGKVFTEESIGGALAGRELANHLREHGAITGGPPPVTKRDRSEYLQRLNDLCDAVRRC